MRYRNVGDGNGCGVLDYLCSMIPGLPYGIDIYCGLWLLIFVIQKTSPAWMTAWMKPADAAVRGRQTGMFLALFSIWAGVLYGLSMMWYEHSGQMGFHWFNDNQAWLQVDKFGHFFTTFQEARLMMLMWQWTGMSQKRASVAGMLGGILYQTPIELLDGFQDAYGASWGDLMANTLGAVALWAQGRWLKDIVVHSKFSISSHPIAAMRPSMFGANFFQQILKDYNGQTYWFSFEARHLLPVFKMLPPWLCISIGYGADGMIGGTENRVKNTDGTWTEYPDLSRTRQVYLSVDVNWDKVRFPTPWLKTSMAVFSLVKIPAPTLEWNMDSGLKWHWVHF